MCTTTATTTTTTTAAAAAATTTAITTITTTTAVDTTIPTATTGACYLFGALANWVPPFLPKHGASLVSLNKIVFQMWAMILSKYFVGMMICTIFQIDTYVHEKSLLPQLASVSKS